MINTVPEAKQPTGCMWREARGGREGGAVGVPIFPPRPAPVLLGQYAQCGHFRHVTLNTHCAVSNQYSEFSVGL